ncbi:ABC transporter, ATP-binding protein [Thermococcus sp. 2319x1]|uniref:ABC transporter ATP-binding protein n=1 Tax=Thermococcus sp. 2319x1 TaxID=1674923 RepID=UPI00073A5AB8|nr:ABC transporter ATP-binding protein [Thermococcus sp. 2319x1]ALV63445.1 ABC transporter, ATP-binding protein [Thermococcus sp. 2319x1]
MNNEVIQIIGVSKSFGNIEVLKNINLRIREGDFVVIAGENGSGKTTLLKVMTGLLIPDEGKVRVLGFDVSKDWKKLSKYIGVALANERSLYWKLTGLENLEIFAGLYGVKKGKKQALEILEKLNLVHVKDKLVEEYSSGMRRKLLLAKATIHNPKILFLDEILNGLDPKSYLEIIEFLEELNQNGITIVLISHVLHDLPQKARLIVMKDGRIVLDDKLSKFKLDESIKIKATINGKEIERIVSENELNETLIELTKGGAKNIQIERDDLYSILRRIL